MMDHRATRIATTESDESSDNASTGMGFSVTDGYGSDLPERILLGSHGFISGNESTAKLAGPLTWIVVGTIIFLAAWLFPPSIYSAFYGVESRVFLDLPSLLYSAACILCTCLGLWIGLGGQFAAPSPRLIAGTDLSNAPNTRIALLLLMILGNLTSVALFVRSGGMAALRASLRGDFTLNEGMRDVVSDSGGSLWVAALMASSVFVPLAYQLYRTQPHAAWTRLLVLIFIGTYVAAALLTSRRNLLAKPLLGILIVYLVWPSRRGLTQLQAITVCTVAASIVLGLFLGLGAIRRGFNDTQDLVSEPLRYLLTPYNTQALMLNGELKLPGTSNGYFWTEFIWKFPLLDNLLNLEGWREYFLGQKGMTGASERAGILLSHGVTTGTAFPAFACSWLDFGWLGALPFAITGWVAGVSWRGLLRGHSCQFLMFPLIAYSFVEWRANLLFPSVALDYALALMAIIHLGLLFEKPSVRST